MFPAHKTIFVSALICIFLIILVVSGALLYTSNQNTIPQTKTSEPITPGLAVTVPGDIYRDGKVSPQDIMIIKQHLGCKKTDPCWTKVIGKTHDGDNPFYGSDLDVNGDGKIDEADIPTLTK
ncbi:hypothetical protein HGA88_06925 [Candidatus Roizmanbacteria bacterium]|nr:hypothetical protein [Candidatus Roizmanbacteria bacterium]